SLWRIVAAPLLWAGHFLASYLTASIWCAKASGAGFGWVRLAIGGYTWVALVAIAAVGWDGWRRHTLGQTELSHGADTPESRHRFLGFATMLLAALSAIAVVYQALPA